MASDPLFENGRLAIKRAKHGHFLYNRHDAFVSRSIDLYGEWGESELHLLGQVLRPGDVVVDVGANIGTHTVAFAAMVGANGMVHAFEPQRQVFHLLCANVALNMLANVVCRPQAVGAAAGKIRMPLLAQEETANFGAARAMTSAIEADGGPSEAVEQIALDALDLPACRLIKIDVEGMEADVLAGADATIARCAPFLFVECNDETLSPRTIEAVLSRGYKAWWHLGPYYNPNNFYGNPVNVFQPFLPERNLFCAPASSSLKLSGLPVCAGADDTWERALKRHQATS